MKIFAAREKRKADSSRNALSRLLRTCCNRVHVSWANWMTQRTKNFSFRSWIVMLILFVITTGGYCIYLAVGAFINPKSDSVKIGRIRRPQNAVEAGDINRASIEISAEEYYRIRRFRLYMDSLARSPSGKLEYDNITSRRPGLMDSIRFIEHYYQQSK